MVRASEELDRLFPQVEPVVRAIVRHKLRAQFHRTDLVETQDALDVVSATLAEVASGYRAGRVGAGGLREYAAVVAYHGCAEYLRQKRAPRHRLQLKLRYFLTHHPRFALWKSAGSERLCGFAAWAPDGRHAPAARLITLKGDPLKTVPDLAVLKLAMDMTPDDWQEPLMAIFDYLGGAVPFADLAAVIATLTLAGGNVDTEITDPPDPAPSPEDWTAANELFRAIWKAILLLPSHWRRAFLLNPPRGFDIDELPARGVATIEEIGDALDLTTDDYQSLCHGLSVDPAHPDLQPSTPAERFACLWQYLPLRDAIIARLFGRDAQHIINLRRLARDDLRERLAVVRAPS